MNENMNKNTTNTEEVKAVAVSTPFHSDSKLTHIVTLRDYVHIMGVLSKDVATMERRLRLVLVYESGEVSTFHEYRLSKLSEKALADLTDMDGICRYDIEDILKAIGQKLNQLNTMTDREKKCSVMQVYRELCKYVSTREQPGEVFVLDGYGHIDYKYLPKVLDKLDCGYERLEVAKAFKTFGLLRTQNGTGHEYAYNVNNRRYLAKGWYFAFKLMNGEDEVAA